MDDTNWTGIGYNSSYAGVFNGGGHTITGLTQTLSRSTGSSNISRYQYGALFSQIASNSIIQNLTLADLTCDFNYMGYVGGIVGYCNGTILNCVVSGNIDASQNTTGNITYMGGIAGYLENGTIINCHNMANITGSSEYGLAKRTYIGGIVGYTPRSNYTIKDCSNSGTLSDGVFIGQIIGYDANTAGPVDSL